MSKTFYKSGIDHPNFNKDRNLSIIKDRYPNWPKTGKTGLTIKELSSKYKLAESRIYVIVRRMKELRIIY